MKKFKSLAFDLDDTLLDTTGLLVPAAAHLACQRLIDAGLNCTLKDCLDYRKKLVKQYSHTEIFTKMVAKFSTEKMDKAIHEALEIFYNPQVPQTLPLLPGAKENILALKEHYHLFIVTMGALEAQKSKIKALNVEQYLDDIYILDGFKGEKKETAFKDILKIKSHAPTQLLSIGNRLSSEIRDGKTVGAHTCYFAFGEHVGEVPERPEDHPDFTIAHHKDLISVCGL